MDRLRKYVTASLLTATMLIPAGMLTRAAAQDDQTVEGAKKEEKAAKADKKAAQADKSARVYDAKHNIYHNWTPREDSAYRYYLDQQHQEYRAYQQLNADQQAAYWDWRGSHPNVPAPAPPPPSY